MSKDRSPAIQRLALLSAVAVLRDLIPAYRIRPPTDKELKMQVSKEVELLRELAGTEENVGWPVFLNADVWTGPGDVAAKLFLSYLLSFASQSINLKSRS